MKFSRIDHVALDVADLQHSIDFYCKHFGFRHYFDQTTPAGLKIGYLKLHGSRTGWQEVCQRNGRLPFLPDYR